MIFVIYGAQGIALGAYNAIKLLHPEEQIACFLVTERGINSATLGGIPVIELSEYIKDKTEEEKANVTVLICTPENVMESIEKSLDEVVMNNHIRIDSLKWACLQEKAFSLLGTFVPLSTLSVGSKKADIEVFKMVHHKDKPLATNYKDPVYVTSVQVGALLTDIRMTEYTDNQGDNISEKNGDYSELTGLYWIWKNKIKRQDDTYYGLAHYRRFLELSEDDLLRLADNDIDVVLPYPMPYEPNIEAHHLRYLSDSEWDAVLHALEELQPDYSKAFKDILKQDYFYNYNVILAKKDVIDDYCSWLFPLLFRIEKINDPNNDKEPNRYMGYVGETLETLYFMYNKDKLKIAHVGCRFLV